MDDLRQAIKTANQTVYNPAGLNMLDPLRVAYLFVCLLPSMSRHLHSLFVCVLIFLFLPQLEVEYY